MIFNLFKNVEIAYRCTVWKINILINNKYAIILWLCVIEN